MALLLVLGLFACTSNLQTKVSGNFNELSPEQIVAILPVEVVEHSPKDAAKLFRQILYSKFKQTHFDIMEHYIVDGLLKQNGLTDPANYSSINPMRMGEVLGADVVLISRLNKVERTYFLLHSSIELSISVQMVDTRSGEILWRAEQTESDYQGFWKIPTGITAALVSPFYFVTNKLNLNRITTKMVDKLTDVVKHPGRAGKENTFESPVIAKAAARDMQKLQRAQKIRAKWSRKFYENADEIWFRDKLAGIHGAPPSSKPVTLKASYQRKLEPFGPWVPSQTQQIPIQIAAGPVAVNPTPVAEKKKDVLQIQKLNLLSKKPSRLYTIQVGAYRQRALAQKLMERLVNKGYQAFMTQPSAKKKTALYRVRVDIFKNKKGAAHLAKKLQSEEHLNNFVTSLNGI